MFDHIGEAFLCDAIQAGRHGLRDRVGDAVDFQGNFQRRAQSALIDQAL